MRFSSGVEGEIVELWRDIVPPVAFSAGFEDCAGQFFVPTKTNMEKVWKRFRWLRAKAENVSQKKFLVSLETKFFLDEPQTHPEKITGAFFSHMIKEGIRPQHMISLAKYGVQALEVKLENLQSKKWAAGVKVLTLIRCFGLKDLIETVRKEAHDSAFIKSLDELAAATKRYEEPFKVKGFKNASFEETFEVLKTEGCELGREKIYADVLRKLYDFKESPEELEAKGLRMLKREFPKFKRLTKRLSKNYGCENDAEAVVEAINKRQSVKPSKLIEFINAVRKCLNRIVHQRIVRFNPKYDTRVIETPPYLTGTIPSGAAAAFNYVKGKPFQLFLATTDETRAPSKAPAEIINLLVHEEYGHCLHVSNSAFGYAAKPSIVEMLDSPLVSISEGISFQRELEFVSLFNKLAREGGETSEEKALVDLLKEYSGVKDLAREYEYFTLRFRILRFLRVIGDARLNSGKQNIVEFVEWAHQETGISKSKIYFNLFPAHEGIAPGYAATYAMFGEKLRKLQSLALKRGKSLVEFNSFACSLGFLPRTVFERRLREFINR